MLLLPPPEGAATTKRQPEAPGLWVVIVIASSYSRFCTCSRICSISTLSSSDDLRQFRVDRLRAQRIRLAVELLREEIEALADAAALREDPPDLARRAS